MLHFLAENVGDHLSAAVANVHDREDRFLEQSVFADELSEASIRQIEKLARRHWQTLLRELAPKLHDMVERDREKGQRANMRARIGMYSFATRMDEGSEK
jgi:hypothetical protein